jgi:hypothetical protein
VSGITVDRAAMRAKILGAKISGRHDKAAEIVLNFNTFDLEQAA